MTQEQETPLRLHALVIDNIKKVRAMELVPDDEIMCLTGRNEAGKSTVLEVLRMFFGGKKYSPENPVTTGKKKGGAVLELGKYTAKLSVTAKGGHYLTLLDEEGKEVPSPQSVLTQMVKNIAFDPSRFIHMESKEQAKVLREILGIDTTELDAKRKKCYDRRTEIGREVSQLEASLKLLPLYKGVPDKEVTTAEITKKISDALKLNQQRTETLKAIQNGKSSVDSLQKHIEDLRTQIVQAEVRITQIENEKKTHAKWLELNPAQDIEVLETQSQELEEINKKVRGNQDRKKTREKLLKVQDDYDTLSEAIKEIDEQKEKLLEGVDMPIQGLTFDEDGIYYDGFPFRDVSTGKALTIATALGISQNPDLRVLILQDGSDIDSFNFAAIRQLAKAEDFLIIIEKMDESGHVGFFIDDGELVSHNPDPDEISHEQHSSSLPTKTVPSEGQMSGGSNIQSVPKPKVVKKVVKRPI